MKVICAWCYREMNPEDGPDDIRYSVCRECLAKFRIYPEKPDAPKGDNGIKEKGNQ